MADALDRLVLWYSNHCDGDWEHDRRIRVGTIDNPGWSLNINLSGTALSGMRKDLVKIERDDKDWIFYKITDDKFEGHCGASNLREMIDIFIGMAESAGANH